MERDFEKLITSRAELCLVCLLFRDPDGLGRQTAAGDARCLSVQAYPATDICRVLGTVRKKRRAILSLSCTNVEMSDDLRGAKYMGRMVAREGS